MIVEQTALPSQFQIAQNLAGVVGRMALCVAGAEKLAARVFERDLGAAQLGTRALVVGAKRPFERRAMLVERGDDAVRDAHFPDRALEERVNRRRRVVGAKVTLDFVLVEGRSLG